MYSKKPSDINSINSTHVESVALITRGDERKYVKGLNSGLFEIRIRSDAQKSLEYRFAG